MPTQLRRHDEPGHTHFWTVSCYRRLTFFWHDAMKRVAVDGLRVIQEKFGICLIAYVVMPDHLHVVLYPHAKGDDRPIPISDLWHIFKKHIGFHGKACLRDVWRRDGKLWSDPLNAWAKGAFDHQTVMETRGYDFNIDREKTLLQKIEYCHKNPLTRELVAHPKDWLWSSFRFYDMDDRSMLSMDWDGCWPIIW